MVVVVGLRRPGACLLWLYHLQIHNSFLLPSLSAPQDLLLPSLAVPDETRQPARYPAPSWTVLGLCIWDGSRKLLYF